MKYFIKVILILSLIISNRICIADDKEQVMYCESNIKKIAEDKHMDSFEEKLNAWKQFEQKCSINGIYEKYLADIYCSYGYYKEAKDIITAVIAKATFDTREHEFLLAITEYELEKFENVKVLAEAMISKYPKWYGGYFHLGSYFVKKKGWANAKKNFCQALQLDKSKSETHAGLAVIYYQDHDYKKVTEHYLTAFKLNPWNAILTRGCSYAAVMSFIELDDLRAASDILSHQEKYDEGIEQYHGYQVAKKFYEEALKKQQGKKSEQDDKKK